MHGYAGNHGNLETVRRIDNSVASTTILGRVHEPSVDCWPAAAWAENRSKALDYLELLSLRGADTFR